MPVTFTVPIVLKSRAVTGQDALGNDVYGVTQTTVAGVFDPGGSVEQVNGRDTVITQPRAFLPTGTSLAAVDALTINGRDYEVSGDPADWPPNPFSGWLPDLSVEVRLERVSG